MLARMVLTASPPGAGAGAGAGDGAPLPFIVGCSELLSLLLMLFETHLDCLDIEVFLKSSPSSSRRGREKIGSGLRSLDTEVEVFWRTFVQTDCNLYRPFISFRRLIVAGGLIEG